MNFSDILKKSVMEGFASADISTTKILITLGMCFLISVYIFFLYWFICKSTFYNKNFNVSMSIISIVVAGIIIAMQTSLVISLGMVGALSIVRFRTAIKEPMDLLFLFWSISNGIMCGAGLYELSIIVAAVITIGILILQLIPISRGAYLLIIHASGKESESEILDIIKKHSPRYKIDSKNIRKDGMDLIVEVRTSMADMIVNEVSDLQGISSASLLYHNGEVKC